MLINHPLVLPPNCISLLTTTQTVIPQMSDYSHVRKALLNKGISDEVTTTIMDSWKPSTQKQYHTVLNKWQAFCHRKPFAGNEASLSLALEFLFEQFTTGIRSSSLGTHRSALSVYLPNIDGYAVGEHSWVVRFINPSGFRSPESETHHT